MRRYKRTRNRRQRSRKQRGGAPADIAALREFMDFYAPDVKLIAMNKPVATPESRPRYGANKTANDIFIELWGKLTEPEKGEFKGSYLQKHGFTLGVHIHTLPRPANHVIFYAEEYLPMLAAATGMETEDILKIIESAEKKTGAEMDIIKVAFGDNFKEVGHGRRNLSESGNALQQAYLDMFSY